MTITAEALNLEREVVDLLASDPADATDERPRSLTRQAALLMLSRCAQSVEPTAELLSEDQFNALAKLDELSGESRASREIAARNARAAGMPGTNDAEREVPPGNRGAEHRAYPRRSYPYLQVIGACRSGQLPPRDEFIEVRCRDISPRGFSFVTDVPPDFLEFIVALGSPPSQLFLQSRVVHVSPFVHHGRDCLLVGCEYIQRIELPK